VGLPKTLRYSFLMKSVVRACDVNFYDHNNHLLQLSLDGVGGGQVIILPIDVDP
jgi:hypothetical protein